MKGLLIKDLLLITKNKQIIGILVFYVLFMLIIGGNAQTENFTGFMISYMTMYGGMIGLSTISIDENEKSLPYLFTMPISRIMYVAEKYVFSFGCSLICWIVTTGIMGIFHVSSMEIIKLSVVLFVSISVCQLITLPLWLKYGGENGRMVVIALVIAVVVGGYLISNSGILTGSAAALWAQGILRLFDQMNDVLIIMIGILVFAIGTFVSMTVSTRIMEKKEL